VLPLSRKVLLDIFSLSHIYSNSHTYSQLNVGTTKAAVGAVTGTLGSLFGAARSTVEGATNTTKSIGGWFS